MNIIIEKQDWQRLREYLKGNAWGGAAQRVEALEAVEDTNERWTRWEKLYDYLEATAPAYDDDGTALFNYIQLNDAIWFDEEAQRIIYPEEYEDEEE